MYTASPSTVESEKGKSKRCFFLLQISGEEKGTRGPTARRIFFLKMRCGAAEEDWFFFIRTPPYVYRKRLLNLHFFVRK